MESSALNLLPPSEQVDSNGSGVGRSQADDTDAREGVESGVGAKVEESEEQLDNHAQHHGVQGHIELLVHAHPQLRTGNGTVTSEGPGAARRSGRAANTTQNAEDHNGDEQAHRTATGSNGALEDGGNGLTRREVDQHGDIRHDEDDGDQEQKTGKGVDDDGRDHGLGDLD